MSLPFSGFVAVAVEPDGGKEVEEYDGSKEKGYIKGRTYQGLLVLVMVVSGVVCCCKYTRTFILTSGLVSSERSRIVNCKE